MWTSLPDLLGITLSEADIERMRLAARWHAKRPTEAFAPAVEKRATVPEDIRRAAAEIGPAYARLEALRAVQRVR